MPTVEWTIENMKRQAWDDIVVLISWKAEVRDGNLVSSLQGTTNVTPAENFIPYEQLTEQDVLNWVQEKLDVQTIESGLLTDLENKRNPPLLHGVPWEQN